MTFVKSSAPNSPTKGLARLSVTGIPKELDEAALLPMDCLPPELNGGVPIMPASPKEAPTSPRKAAYVSVTSIPAELDVKTGVPIMASSPKKAPASPIKASHVSVASLPAEFAVQPAYSAYTVPMSARPAELEVRAYFTINSPKKAPVSPIRGAHASVPSIPGELDTVAAHRTVVMATVAKADEKIKSADMKKLQAKINRENKTNALKKFGDNVRLHISIPSDLVPLITNFPAKQKELQQKAYHNPEASNAVSNFRAAKWAASSGDFDKLAATLITSPPQATTCPTQTLFSTTPTSAPFALRTKKPSKTKRRKVKAVAAIPTLPDAHCNELERKLGHFFKDPSLLWEALQAHGNGIKEIGGRSIEDGNKKLALVGDAMMRAVILGDWRETGESRRDGHNLSCAVGNNRHLDKCGRKSGLEAFIVPNRSSHKGGVLFIPAKTMAATVEALVGAVYEDSGKSLSAVGVAMKGLGLYNIEG